MNLSDYFKQLFDYHYWANARVLSAAEGLSEAQLFQPLAHFSNDCVHATLLHMLGAEWIWLRRCLGESPERLPSAEDLPALSDLRRRWQEQEGEVRAFLDGFGDAASQRAVDYRTTRGVAHRLALWQILAHVANHATHHRGELAAMFAQLGVAHEEEDILYYALQKSGQRHL